GQSRRTDRFGLPGADLRVLLESRTGELHDRSRRAYRAARGGSGGAGRVRSRQRVRRFPARRRRLRQLRTELTGAQSLQALQFLESLDIRLERTAQLRLLCTVLRQGLLVHAQAIDGV